LYLCKQIEQKASSSALFWTAEQASYKQKIIMDDYHAEDFSLTRA